VVASGKLRDHSGLTPRQVARILRIGSGVCGSRHLRKLGWSKNVRRRSFPNHENFFVDTEFSWYPGKESYHLAKNVRVIPLTELAQIEG